MSHHTYHDKHGKFTSKKAAATVTKDGERFKVVRQYRRIKGGRGEKVTKHQRKMKSHEKVVEAIELARARVAHIRGILGRSHVSVTEALRVSLAEDIIAATPGKFVLSKKGNAFYAEFKMGGYRKVDEKMAMRLFKKARKKMVHPDDVFDPFLFMNESDNQDE